MRSRTTAALFAAAPPVAAALVGAIGSRDAAAQFARADRPSWAPPAQVFGPVWSALYASIGVAGWRLLRGDAGAPALALHGTQLALNALWPFAYFRARDRSLALTVNVALDVAIAAEIAAAWRTDRAAAAALGPYFAWSVFATALAARVRLPEMH